MVANPMGNAARKSDCVGCCIMAFQMAGHKVYLRIEIPRKSIKRATLRTKNITESQ
jgi:hypothetical protein